MINIENIRISKKICSGNVSFWKNVNCLFLLSCNIVFFVGCFEFF